MNKEDLLFFGAGYLFLIVMLGMFSYPIISTLYLVAIIIGALGNNPKVDGIISVLYLVLLFVHVPVVIFGFFVFLILASHLKE